MADKQKQNWRWQQADARWRKRVVWPTDDPCERRVIRGELRRDRLNLELDKAWRRLYQNGYDPRNPDKSKDDPEWKLIEQLAKERDCIARRTSRWERETGKDAEELMGRYRQLQVKSVCF